MERRVVFICGLNRSGTSLLHRMLRAHPEISGFTNTGALEDEGQHLQTVIPPARLHGGAGKFCFDHNAYLTEHSALNTPENKATLLAQWSAHWDMRKPVLVEKSPPNLIRMRLLAALFPQSRFIIVARHPLAVALATLKWAKTSVPELVEHWVLGYQAALKDAGHLPGATLLRYEDLVADPAGTLEGLWRFIGVAPHASAEAVEPDVNGAYFRQWEAMGRTDPMLLKRVRLLHALPNRFGYFFQPSYVRPAAIAL